MSAQAYFDALVRQETTLWNAVEKRLRGDGTLSLARLEVLRVIDASPAGVRVQEVADAVGTTIGAASRLLDRIAADGIVERSADPDDRRSVRITLTAAGREALALTGARFDAVLDEVLAAVDPEDLRLATAALERIQAASASGLRDR